MVKLLLKRVTNSFFLWIFFFGSVAYSACSYQITSITPVSFIWSGGTVNGTGQIMIRRGNTGNYCRGYHLTLSSGQANNYNPRKMNLGSSHLNYNIYKNSNRTRIVYEYPDATQNGHILRGRFSKNSRNKRVRFWTRLISPPPIAGLEGGVYTDNLSVKLYEGRNVNPNALLKDSANLFVSTNVPIEMNLSLVNSGSPFNSNDTSQVLNFGVLHTGDIQNFDLRVESNTAYKVYFSSSNNGKLKRSGGSSIIGYSLKVNGSLKNLSGSSSTPIEVGSGSSSSSGVHPVSTEIGNVGLVEAGNYQDFITIEVSAQ